MTRIILIGCNGKMGNAVAQGVSKREDCEIFVGVDINPQGNHKFPVFENIQSVPDGADVIIDFSSPLALDSILKYAKEHNMPCVLCATGYSSVQVEKIKACSSELAVFYSGNMSLGINLTIELAKTAARVLGRDFDIEIIEKHHNQKLDAPSGTALMLADAISTVFEDESKYVYDRHSMRKKREKNEIGIHSIRGGTIVGEHEIIFAGDQENISIKHTATSKEVFALGAVNAAVFMNGKKSGLFDMNDLVKGNTMS